MIPIRSHQEPVLKSYRSQFCERSLKKYIFSRIQNKISKQNIKSFTTFFKLSLSNAVEVAETFR